MSKWLGIGAGCLLGGIVGWNMGQKFLGPTGTVVAGLLFAMAGTFAGWNMSRER
ncbi:MAG: hypothetical protein H6686_12375 [Fibrobacteria bacterium]|nr:hypothetical protein [Fibrobacteria bacterium]